MSKTDLIAAGTVIVSENEASRVMYVIKSGRARVFKKYQDAKIVIAHLGPGDVFGELSLLDSRPRSASVEAVTDLEVVTVGVNQGENQLSSLPVWALAMMRTLANRIREADKQIAGLRSLAEYEKKALRVDTFTRTLYRELRRAFTLLKIASDEAQARNEPQSAQEFRARWLELMGPELIPLDKLWEYFVAEGLVAYTSKDRKQIPPVTIDPGGFDKYVFALDLEIMSGRYLMLTPMARNFLGRLCHLLGGVEGEKEILREEVVTARLGVGAIPDSLYREGVAELSRAALANSQKDGEVFSCDLTALRKLLPVQELLHKMDSTGPSGGEMGDDQEQGPTSRAA